MRSFYAMGDFAKPLASAPESLQFAGWIGSQDGRSLPFYWAAAGTLFTFFLTALGAAAVFCFKGRISARAQRICLGFAGGVMAAASVFSLLIPAEEQLETAGGEPWLVVTLGFAAGCCALMALERTLEHVYGGEDEAERSRMLMLLAVTLHNIPEGMAVGLAFASAAQAGTAQLAAAATLALGIGIQNIPEGAAVSLPLRQGGMSRRWAFLFGALSGAAEPLFGVLAVLAISAAQAVMPALMAFCAGAMMLVVFCEMVPEAAKARAGIAALAAGYALMMALDIGLG